MKKSNAASKPTDLSSLEAGASDVASLLRAMANERRLMLLCLLIEHGERSAGALAEGVGLSPSATSQHLAKMREEGLVACRREAQTIHYRIADPRTTRLVALLKELYC
jgi:ArsR family transcriptional regulator, virulence genes transcriptional regulator